MSNCKKPVKTHIDLDISCKRNLLTFSQGPVPYGGIFDIFKIENEHAVMTACLLLQLHQFYAQLSQNGRLFAARIARFAAPTESELHKFTARVASLILRCCSGDMIIGARFSPRAEELYKCEYFE